MLLWMIAIAAQAAAVPQPLPPVGKWNIEYADQSCVLSRRFGSADAPVALAFTSSPATATEVSLITPELKKGTFWFANATLTSTPAVSEPGPQSIEYPVTSEWFRTQAVRITRLTVINDQLAALLQSGSALTISVPDKKMRFTLATGPMKSVLTAVDACRVNLVKQWGFDPAKTVLAAPFRRSVTDRPTGLTKDLNISTAWFRSSDFPTDPDGTMHGGRVTAMWQIDRDRKIHDCRIIRASGSKSLDEGTCALIVKRGAYTPIVDDRGKPVESWDTATVNWQIPQ